ncbi:MAG TPA: DUF4382 domain-containing protein [Nitrospiraceae bacterium]|jgi:hypothetical protein|nr:DUF4382 domain-containing protein [Nitrospiraceae bacterium]
MNKIKHRATPVIWLMGFLLAVVVAGCGSSGNGGGGATAQPGTVSVSMTDAPACGYDAVNVTVSKVRIHQSDDADENAAGWTDITLDPARKINLLDLNDPTQPNFALEALGESPLAAGHYTQLRLVLVPNSGGSPLANSVVLSTTPGEIALDTPSAVHSGIKLIHQFTVGSGQRVDLLLDFDACKSIVHTGSGKYKLKPVIHVIPFVLNGIEGFVDNTLPNVNVSAQVNGDIVRATMLNTQTGKFFLAHLPAGVGVTYDVVITADNHATAVISGVPVPTDTSITAVSTSGAPIPVVTPPTLEASATHSISGTVTLNPATDDETVLVAAKQALNAGPTVTVKSAPAMVLDTALPVGDYGYSLTLPIGAPSLGPYATPLPIVFTRQPSAVAGQYTVQVSADGYATKSSLAPVDISGGDKTSQDFTLTP